MYKKKNFSLPILFRPQITNSHKISHINLLMSEEKIITGALSGEILIWKLNIQNKFLEPIIFLVPCLNQEAGKITSMCLYSQPIQYLTV